MNPGERGGEKVWVPWITWHGLEIFASDVGLRFVVSQVHSNYNATLDFSTHNCSV